MRCSSAFVLPEVSNFNLLFSKMCPGGWIGLLITLFLGKGTGERQGVCLCWGSGSEGEAKKKKTTQPQPHNILSSLWFRAWALNQSQGQITALSLCLHDYWMAIIPHHALQQQDRRPLVFDTCKQMYFFSLLSSLTLILGICLLGAIIQTSEKSWNTIKILVSASPVCWH